MQKSKNKESNIINFEKSFSRLEEILETMNSGTVSLDKSLALYEEADNLLSICSKHLNEAEKKIETLIKKRNGELEINSKGDPKTKEFNETSLSSENG